MAQTITVTGNQVRNNAVGRFLDTGTVAATDIVCGFKPRYIRVVNVASGDMLEWFEGMADDSAIKTVAAGTRTILSSDGIIPLVRGFTLGLDTDVLVTSQQISYVAQG